MIAKTLQPLADCAPGFYPMGVDQAGNALGCMDAVGRKAAVLVAAAPPIWPYLVLAAAALLAVGFFFAFAMLKVRL